MIPSWRIERKKKPPLFYLGPYWFALSFAIQECFPGLPASHVSVREDYTGDETILVYAEQKVKLISA